MEGDAAARAFAVPELLESILLHLPASDLLRSQGVSKHFSGVFKSSIKIQRTLCFVADPATHRRVRMNPLLGKIFPPCVEECFFDRSICYGPNERDSDSVGTKNKWKYCDVVMSGRICRDHVETYMDDDDDDEKKLLSQIEDGERYMHLPDLTEEILSCFTPAQRHPHASWRNMLPTQPPIPVHIVFGHPYLHDEQLPAGTKMLRIMMCSASLAVFLPAPPPGLPPQRALPPSE